MSSPCLLTGFSSCSPWSWNFTLCTSCLFLSPALSIPTPFKQQQDLMVETSCTGLYSQTSSKLIGRSLWKGSTDRHSWQQSRHSRSTVSKLFQSLMAINFLSQGLIMLQFLLIDAKIVFKYLGFSSGSCSLTPFSCSQQWFRGCYRLFSGIKQEMGNAGTWRMQSLKDWGTTARVVPSLTYCAGKTNQKKGTEIQYWLHSI